MAKTKAIAKVAKGRDLSKMSETSLEKVVLKGDISTLTPDERVKYVISLCRALKLNPAMQPLKVITLQGRMVLYADRNASDQLRKINGISVMDLKTEEKNGCFIVTVQGKDTTGRVDSELGSVNIEGLRGEARSNAMMKAITKAKRRLTLSMSGLGILDELEVETIPGARAPSADMKRV